MVKRQRKKTKTSKKNFQIQKNISKSKSAKRCHLHPSEEWLKEHGYIKTHKKSKTKISRSYRLELKN